MFQTASSKAGKATSRLQAQLQKAEEDKQTEKEKRNELFNGAAAQTATPPEPEVPEAEMTTAQLVKKAQRTHQETTAIAQSALKVVENTKQIQAATMSELEDQSKQLKGIDKSLNQMNEDITYSEKLLRYMRSCCCCWMFESCTGADPEGQRTRKWERDVDKGKTAKAVDDAVQQALSSKEDKGGKKGGKKGAGGAGPSHRDPDIKLTPEFASTEMALHEETRKQNVVIDQIGDGVSQLLQGARNMKAEVDAQNKVADGINAHADATSGRIKDMSTKSQLRKFK